MSKSCGCSHSKCNKTPKGKICPKHGMEDCSISESTKPSPSEESIAKKHNVSVDLIKRQAEIGSTVEREHVTTHEEAYKIALQHLNEFPDYYTHLLKMEKELKAKHKKDKVHENHIAIAMGKELDDEGSMAMNQLDEIEHYLGMLKKVIKDPNMQIPGWVQSKITLAADYLNSSALYMSSKNENVKEEYKRINKGGQIMSISFSWRGIISSMKIFFPNLNLPTRDQIEDAIHKFYPGATVLTYSPAHYDVSQPMVMAKEEIEYVEEAVLGRYKEDKGGGKTLRPASERISKSKPKIVKLKPQGPRKGEATASQVQGWRGSDRTNTNRKGQSAPHAKPIKEEIVGETLAIILDPDKEKKRKNYLLNIGVIGETAAWTRKSGKNPEGGLNEKGRKSYERENPGSDLKAPSKKVGNPRRASFCARMSGMKKKLTSAKTANDPDSRINKSLRAWNC